ncbi:DUF6266 family protein [Pedobacter sp. JY14-1]|uniref:DUF6266 family protein n=1 Tax=Pedobacter sp. JY14-1 TaxID=3034151 RepID=UPI0023E12022|nr:DUF6266 family protein [Pedobacter sp. JY14-1]
MAKIKSGILGGVSGTLGPITGGIWKGIPYLRAKSNKKKKMKPATLAQIESRQKLRFMNNFLVPFHPYLTIGFMHDAEQRTEISAAFSKNYHIAVGGAYPDYIVNYDKFQISIGDLPMITDVTISRAAPDLLEFTWNDNNSSPKARCNDQLMLVLYSEELHKAFGITGGVDRVAKSYVYKLPPEAVGKQLHVYLSVTSSDRKCIANSAYFGVLLTI